MLSNIIHHKTYQGGADTIRIGSEIWMMGLPEYTALLNTNAEVVPSPATLTIKVGSLFGRWLVYLDENVPYNEIWVCREQPTYRITLEDTEGDMPIVTFNYADMFDNKKLRGRIKINE